MIIADTNNPGAPETIKISLRGWMIWGVAALFYLYEFFVRVAPATMAPELQEAFGLSAAGLGAAVAVYYTIYSPTQLLAGSFFDRFGAKAILVPASLVCTLGAFLEVLGHDAFWLSVARFCQGLGSAFAFVGTMYLAAEWFPRSMLARLSGLTTSLGMAGAIMGNAGIAHVVQTLGWKTALIVAGVVGLVVTALIFFVVPSKGSAPGATASKGAGGLKALTIPYSNPLLVFLFGWASRLDITKALWIVYSNPQSWLAGITGTALYMPLSILGALWGEEYIGAVSGVGKDAAAGAVSMLYVGWLIGGPIAGWYSDKTGNRRNLLFWACLGTLLISVLVVSLPGMTITWAYILMLLLGLASTSQVVCFVTAVEHNPAQVAGTAIAATNMMIMLLGGMGEWFFGELLNTFSGGVGTAPGTVVPPSAYRHAILLLPAISVVGLAAAWFLTEPKKHQQVLVTAE